MFGTRVRPPRPVLLIVVFGVFLAIIGITATAQSALVGAHFSANTLNDVVGSDAATTRAVVNAYVRPSDLDPAAGPAPDDVERARAAAVDVRDSNEDDRYLQPSAYYVVTLADKVLEDENRKFETSNGRQGIEKREKVKTVGEGDQEVVVVATKVDQGQTARVDLAVLNLAGSGKTCRFRF